jgi:hypothetical protein
MSGLVLRGRWSVVRRRSEGHERRGQLLFNMSVNIFNQREGIIGFTL